MGIALTLDFLEHTVIKHPYLWERINTIPHSRTSTTSAVGKVEAKLEMCTFNNQNGPLSYYLMEFAGTELLQHKWF